MHLIDCYTELMVYVSRVAGPDPSGERSLESVAGTIGTLVERSREKADESGFDRQVWKEGFFPVCAWIDETILCSAWEEGKGWGGHQLQRKYFNTANAGEEFFINMKHAESMSPEVREIYDCCLSLGFTGRYYGEKDGKQLDAIKSDVAGKIFQGDVGKLPESLYEEAYDRHAAGHMKKRRFRMPSVFEVLVFLLPVAVVAALYFFFAYDLDKVVTNYFGTGM